MWRAVNILGLKNIDKKLLIKKITPSEFTEGVYIIIL